MSNLTYYRINLPRFGSCKKVLEGTNQRFGRFSRFDADSILRENGSLRGLALGVSRPHLDRLLRPYRTGGDAVWDHKLYEQFG